MTWSPCVAASKQKSQGFCNSNYWIRAWQHWIKVRVPLRKTSFWWIEACNWSKNNFSEIQISQGLDWRFPPWHIFLSWPPPSTNDVIWTDQEGKVEEKTGNFIASWMVILILGSLNNHNYNGNKITHVKTIVFLVDRTLCSLVVLTKSQNLAVWPVLLKMK